MGEAAPFFLNLFQTVAMRSKMCYIRWYGRFSENTSE